MKKYSNEYFWPEIEDELDGYSDRDNISEFKSALIHFRKREFKTSEFEIFCTQNNYKIKNTEKLFEVMYDCGAISNKMEGETYFSKMKDGNNFNNRLNVFIHRGALKALGLG